MPDHHVEADHRGPVQRVDGQPGWVADDVEVRVFGVPLLGEAGAQQTVDLDAAVQFLAEVLPPGVGDAQRQRQLEHGGGAGTVNGTDGGGGVPRRAVRAEVAEETGVEEGGYFTAVPGLAQLPGVQRQGRPAFGQRQLGTGQAGGQQWGGDRAAAFGPGGVGSEDGGSDGEPVQGKEPRNSGEYSRASVSDRPSRLFGVGCIGWPSSRACSAARNKSASSAGCSLRSAMKVAVRRAESATRATRSTPWVEEGASLRSTGGAVVVPVSPASP